MEVLAYTSGGDGVRTTPIHCQTEQDAPEAPTAVKALVMSADSILVSWKPPTEPNGIIEYYMVYYKETGNNDDKPKSQKIVPNLRNQNLSFQAKNLDSNLKYEFWVTAATTIGEGQPSKKVTVSPSTSVPAKIASFDDTFTTTYKEDVTLPCLAVGVPTPVITWTIKGVKFSANTNDRVRQHPDGSLFIRDITRSDAGEYSCKVENDYGQDFVTHHLIVNAPPNAPIVQLTSTTTNSLTVKLKPHDTDGEPIHGTPFITNPNLVIGKLFKWDQTLTNTLSRSCCVVQGISSMLQPITVLEPEIHRTTSIPKRKAKNRSSQVLINSLKSHRTASRCISTLGQMEDAPCCTLSLNKRKRSAQNGFKSPTTSNQEVTSSC
ncbi:unnamed protein product [Diabrotica balteata]|uniref:Uncharacterized protein n=1 Tax=Diabrotica balteata TaxID=107213 RepID=A0A9P0GW30_DIABA|nr:unnamed protein product [Diabrotica balteata]